MDESAVAHRAFLAYLDLGPDRTLRPAAERVGKSVALMKKWSSRHDWRLRAEAYDAAEMEESRESAERARRDAYARRTEHAEQIEKIAMAGLRTLLVRDPASGELRFHSSLKPTDVAALIRAACQLLPPARPEPGSEEERDEELARLSTGELRALLNMLPREEEPTDAECETEIPDLE